MNDRRKAYVAKVTQSVFGSRILLLANVALFLSAIWWNAQIQLSAHDDDTTQFKKQSLEAVSLLPQSRISQYTIETSPTRLKNIDLFDYHASIISPAGTLTPEAIDAYSLTLGQANEIDKYLLEIYGMISQAEREHGVRLVESDKGLRYRYEIQGQAQAAWNMLQDLPLFLNGLGLEEEVSRSLAKLIEVSRFYQESFHDRTLTVQPFGYDIIIVCETKPGSSGEMITVYELLDEEPLPVGDVQQRYLHIISLNEHIEEIRSKMDFTGFQPQNNHR